MQHRYEGNIFSGEKRTELLVVPALSVRVTPEIAIIPAASIRRRARRRAARPRPARGRAVGPGRTPPPPPTRRADGPPAAEREVRVTVVNDSPGPAESVVKLELPQGWTATPAEQPVKFSRRTNRRPCGSW